MVREERRVDQDRTARMLNAVRDAVEYAALSRGEYRADNRLGRFARRGLRNCVFEFCESASRLSESFRKASDLP
jgi:hypothetical protein